MINYVQANYHHQTFAGFTTPSLGIEMLGFTWDCFESTISSSPQIIPKVDLLLHTLKKPHDIFYFEDSPQTTFFFCDLELYIRLMVAFLRTGLKPYVRPAKNVRTVFKTAKCPRNFGFVDEIGLKAYIRHTYIYIYIYMILYIYKYTFLI